MEKLLELMNDYAHTYADHYDDTGEEITITFFSHGDQCFQYVCDGSYETLVDDIAISKRFGFISWLVENDKVKIPHELDELPAMYGYDYDSAECKADRLLMLLAIQDEPIRFLCEILK